MMYPIRASLTPVSMSVSVCRLGKADMSICSAEPFVGVLRRDSFRRVGSVSLSE